MQFPELSMIREFLDKLKCAVWTPDPDDVEEVEPAKKRSKWDETAPEPEKPKNSIWAKKWRKIMKAVLPRGLDSATPMIDPEVRKMIAVMWTEVADWAKQEGLERHLGLFTAEPVRQPDGDLAPPTDQWCFVPAVDLLLVVGDGIVGTTAEGAFADNPRFHEPVTYEEAVNPPVKKVKERSRSRGSRSRDRDRDDGKWQDRGDGDENERDKEKKDQHEAFASFDWENEWRTRTAKTNRKRRDPSWPTERKKKDRWRSESRDRSRDRRRKDKDEKKKSRSRSRRRSRSKRRKDRD